MSEWTSAIFTDGVHFRFLQKFNKIQFKTYGKYEKIMEINGKRKKHGKYGTTWTNMDNDNDVPKYWILKKPSTWHAPRVVLMSVDSWVENNYRVSEGSRLPNPCLSRPFFFSTSRHIHPLLNNISRLENSNSPDTSFPQVVLFWSFLCFRLNCSCVFFFLTFVGELFFFFFHSFSGGENISSIEVETVLHQHEGVLHVAVVAVEDDHWGEVPVAVVEGKQGIQVCTYIWNKRNSRQWTSDITRFAS